MPVATSFDPSGRYGLQTPFSDVTAHLWKGSKWHVEPGRDSLITTGNGGSEPTHAALTLFYNNGKSSYTIEKLLEPDEQIWADVGELIRDQIPDKNGKTIPPDTMMGSYELRDLDHLGVGHIYEGKLVLDKTWGHGYYGCASCCGCTAAALWVNPYSGAINTGGYTSAEAQDSCGENWEDLTNEAESWASSNASVATLAAYGSTNFVGVGSAGGSATLQLQRPSFHCPTVSFFPKNALNTFTVSLSPAVTYMSTGDQPQLTATVSPSSVNASIQFSSSLSSNPNSNCPSALTIPSGTSANGTLNEKITASNPGRSGIFAVSATGSKSNVSVEVPPQVLIQVLYGEAHGQAVGGDTVSEPAIGSSIKDRFGDSDFPGGTAATYQAVIISSQYAGISTSITTGVQPELNVAASLFDGRQSDTVAGSPCFFSPDAAGWSAVQAALKSGTTVVPNVNHDPDCYGNSRQIVYKASIGNNVNAPGVPAFLFERQKASDSNPAVVQI